jgi:hypothetical protein
MTDINKLAPEEASRISQFCGLIKPMISEAITQGISVAMAQLPVAATTALTSGKPAPCALQNMLWIQSYTDALNRGYIEEFCVQRANTAVESYNQRFKTSEASSEPDDGTIIPDPALTPAV